MEKLILLFVLVFSTLIACNKGTEDNTIPTVESVEDLDAIIAECRDNELKSRLDIEANLIGEWQLIGIRAGWVNEFSKQDISLNINNDSIILSDHTSGEDSVTEWTLQFFEVNNSSYFYLETNEDTFNNRLGMETFCNKYMFGTGRVDDGNTYVYTKLR